MAKVWFDAKDKMYKHENGQEIPAYDVRTLPQHRKEVLKIAGLKPGDDINVPIENETQAEIKYVEQLLGGGQ